MGKMYRTGWAGIGCFLVLTSCAAAEPMYTLQQCKPLMELAQDLGVYGEDVLFVGNTVQQHISGAYFDGYMLFQVNQETGTWSMVTLFTDGMACVTAVGENFQPYID